MSGVAVGETPRGSLSNVTDEQRVGGGTGNFSPMVESLSSASSTASKGVARVAISGSSGLIGSALAASLSADGVEIRRLRRGAKQSHTDIVWDIDAYTIDAPALEGTDAVINLAGEPIDHRWTASRKQRIRDSRVRGTSLLAQTLTRLRNPPRVLVSGSAVGIYGDRGDELLDERSAPGSDWLSIVTKDWEEAAHVVQAAGIRLVSLRTGIVLSTAGGALRRMLLPFRWGLGGPLGSGEQWMSWIVLNDLVRVIRHAMDSESLSGPVNAVAPNAIRNKEFAKALGRVLRRPAALPVPAVALELLFGEMARGALLASLRVAPAVLLGSGFQFREETAEAALRSLLTPEQQTL